MSLNFDTVTFTFDLWPWTFVVCRLCRSQTLYKISAQSENPRRSYCSLNFVLMTLNMYHVLRYALRYVTHSLNSVKLSVHEMWRLFHANTSCHTMTLTFDPLTLKVCGRSGGVVALSVEYRTCDREVVDSSLGRTRGAETLGKFLTPVYLCSPSSISWYRPKGGDALRLGSKGRFGSCVVGR